MSNTALLGSYGAQDSSSLMFRNRIINGGMDVWQRGTTGATAGSATPGQYVSADRWKIAGIDDGVSTAVTSLAQVTTGLPAGFQYAAKVAATSANADTMRVFQYIESANCFDLVGKKVTISAKIKRLATLTTPIIVQLFYLNTKDTGATNAVFAAMDGTTLIESFNHTPATADWEDITFTTAAVLPAQAANGLVVSFYYAQNNMGATDKFAITGVQLEAGPTATPFERRPIGVETQLCMRYYQRFNAGNSALLNATYQSPTTCESCLIPYIVPMRDPNNVTMVALTSGITVQTYLGATIGTVTSVDIISNSKGGSAFRVQATGTNLNTAQASFILLGSNTIQLNNEL